MNSTAHVANWETILIAISESEKPSVTKAELIVLPYLAFPHRFGFECRGQMWPDSNRVLSKVMGARGLVTSDYLRQTGDRYSLTSSGKACATAALRRLTSTDLTALTKASASLRR